MLLVPWTTHGNPGFSKQGQLTTLECPRHPQIQYMTIVSHHLEDVGDSSLLIQNTVMLSIFHDLQEYTNHNYCIDYVGNSMVGVGLHTCLGVNVNVLLNQWKVIHRKLCAALRVLVMIAWISQMDYQYYQPGVYILTGSFGLSNNTIINKLNVIYFCLEIVYVQS